MKASQDWWFELVPERVRRQAADRHEQEKGRFPKHAYMDLIDLRDINRFSGEAVDALIEMGLAERRRSGGDAPGSAFTTLLDSVVVEDAKPALAELGRLLPYAVHLAAQWVETSIGALTDGRNLMNAVECPLWAGYLLGQHFDIRTFKMLRPVYQAAAMLLDPSAASAKRWSMTEHLAQHAILAMINGVAAGDDAGKLLPTILDRVAVVDRKQAY